MEVKASSHYIIKMQADPMKKKISALPTIAHRQLIKVVHRKMRTTLNRHLLTYNNIALVEDTKKKYVLKQCVRLSPQMMYVL
jgi:hypothetical protein